MNFEVDLEKALEYLGHAFGVAFIYYWALGLLGFWIDEENKRAYSISGKVITILICIGGSTIVATALGFMVKSSDSGLTAFIVILVCSFIAAVRKYTKRE